jgi:hypothetical protein
MYIYIYVRRVRTVLTNTYSSGFKETSFERFNERPEETNGIVTLVARRTIRRKMYGSLWEPGRFQTDSHIEGLAGYSWNMIELTS